MRVEGDLGSSLFNFEFRFRFDAVGTRVRSDSLRFDFDVYSDLFDFDFDSSLPGVRFVFHIYAVASRKSASIVSCSTCFGQKFDFNPVLISISIQYDSNSTRSRFQSRSRFLLGFVFIQSLRAFRQA